MTDAASTIATDAVAVGLMVGAALALGLVVTVFLRAEGEGDGALEGDLLGEALGGAVVTVTSGDVDGSGSACARLGTDTKAAAMAATTNRRTYDFTVTS